MSLVVERFLMCDICHCNFGVDNRSYSARKQRYHAKSEGWIHSKGKDFCPDCNPKKP